ncbi:hypothetical protein LOTGIDRAFT_228477 [Lottia gigantea]|uniref:HMG box domain-containing protein n=1 Tax=Lottia gigantea TaxID=225164 RepID=V4BX64_LOTGI|nr:hypothetical protein LOTGIDRAFT_228477 [Lottia gigantea]ESO93659.1 hypothetical protein LOTGIDRAFT_228477 [Lottia gigantea]
MKTQKNYTTQNVASYTVFYQENRPKMTSKYPFLTADQINCRLRDQWKKLAKKEKKNFAIPKVCVTPSKVNTGIKKKVKAEDQELKKSTPNKPLFCEENPKIANLILSKTLKQKSVADWLDTNKQKLAESKTYSGVVNPVKDVPEVYDRTPHLKTGILKNTERSVSLEKSRQEGRTPAKVTFTPINKQGRKLAIANRFTDDFKTGNESNSMEYIQPKNLKHDFEIDEDRQSEVQSYTCDFDDGGDEDESNEIDREDYSDSDDDNLLHYHHENDEDDTQQTEESNPRTPISKPVSQTCKNTDQIVPNSSDASSEICTTASSTPKASKAPKPLKNGLTTPSQSKRTLRPRKRNTSQEENVVEIPSFEKGISPKMFGLHKERGNTNLAKLITGDLNHQEEKQLLVLGDPYYQDGQKLVLDGKKLVKENLKACQVPNVNQMKEMETEHVKKSNRTKKTGRKDNKKDDNKTAGDEELGCRRTAKRKTRNKKPVYENSILRESGDFDDLGNITSKKKMKTKVLPGLFDEYDIELISKEECIKNQDKLISEFPAFQHCENKMKNNQKDDFKSGIGYDLKKLVTEKLQDKNELTGKALDTIKTMISTPQKSNSKKTKEKENLKNNNNIIDNEFEDIDIILEDFDEPVTEVKQDFVDINNNSSENLDEKEDTSLFGLKSFTCSFKLGKPDSFSSCYDDDTEYVEDQLSCSNGNNTLQKILSSLRQIGSQSSVEDEESNILDADDEPMDVEESPKILSPTLSGVSELSSLSEVEHKLVDKPGKKNILKGRKQPSRVKKGKGSETEELQDEEPPEFHDVNNKVIPRGEICEMFDEISPPNKKFKKSKERRQYYYWARTTVSDLCTILGCRHQTLTYLSQIRSE